MLCLKHFLAFFLLLPFPAAPPVVTLLFAIVMFHRFRACAYCSVLVSQKNEGCCQSWKKKLC